MAKLVEFEPKAFSRILLSHGLNDSQIREITSEFSKNNNVIDDEVLVGKLSAMGFNMYQLISVFNKLGVGSDNVVRMLERKQKQKLGAFVDIYSLEVDDP